MTHRQTTLEDFEVDFEVSRGAWFSDVDFKNTFGYKHHLYNLFMTLLQAAMKVQDEDSKATM